MRRISRKVALLALVAFALPLFVASAASAQYREFTGKVDKLNNKKMIVDNRMGDKVTFERVKDTKVDDTAGDGKERESWRDLKQGDWVTVKWKMMDKPRKAYEIIVLPPKEEAGEDM